MLSWTERRGHNFFFLSLSHSLADLSLTAALQVSSMQHWSLQAPIFPSRCQTLEFPWVLTFWCLLSSFSHCCSMWFHREWLAAGSGSFGYPVYTFSMIREGGRRIKSRCLRITTDSIAVLTDICRADMKTAPFIPSCPAAGSYSCFEI